jgi:hypothetical protein
MFFSLRSAQIRQIIWAITARLFCYYCDYCDHWSQNNRKYFTLTEMKYFSIFEIVPQSLAITETICDYCDASRDYLQLKCDHDAITGSRSDRVSMTRV